MKRVLCLVASLLLTLRLFAAEDLSSIQWETNMDDPPIGDPNAIKGGTWNDFLPSYPLTFRLRGPNNNDFFANWNGAYTINFSLVWRHPFTDHYIPCMATHWSIQKDQKTVYYKLDKDARWSDGKPVTADDYVFSLEMMKSKEIIDPFANAYAEDYFQSVEKIDDYTLKIVGKKPSWRPLEDFGLYPTPRQAIHLGPNWVKEANNDFQVAAGPYVVTLAEPGKRVVFSKVKNWWGTNKRYFQGLYNVDTINLMVLTEIDQDLDYFKKGQLSLIQVWSAKRWSTEMNFDALKKGWAHRKRVFVDFPQGVYGLAMNLEVPLFQNKEFRKALQYLLNFPLLNKELMYNAYYRITSAFEGSEYANPDLIPYPFDPRKARESLVKAGFTKRGDDGILVDANGNRASFTLSYGTKTIERHLTVIREIYQHAGIEMNLKLLESATAFERALERKYEMTVVSYTTGFYPDPYQYFDSIFKKTTNNNNIWYFGSEATDKLIDIYRFDLDKQKRLDAMHRLDAIIQDDAFYIPFWYGPYHRFVYWDYVCFPATFLPKRTDTFLDWQVWWIDPAKQKRLEQAMAKGESLGEDTVIDVDPYGVKERLEKKEREAEALAAPSPTPKSGK